MKTLVCYGDSNTWGFIPRREESEIKDARFGRDVRWTGRLQALVKDEYRVEEEGLNGRTTVFDDPLDETRNGLRGLDYCLHTKMPVDLLVIMLGTNDTKRRIGVEPRCIARGMERLVLCARGKGYGPGGGDPAILLIAPPSLRETVDQGWLVWEFDRGSIERSKLLGAEYRKVAEKNGCHFWDASSCVCLSEADGVHMDPENHGKFAAGLWEKLKSL